MVLFVVKGLKKHFSPTNIALALIMFGVIYLLRTFLLPDVFKLSIDHFPNISFEFSIPKDILAGVIGLLIRLGLKGVLEDIFAEWSPTQKMPIPHVMMSEQNKGEGIGGPSGSGISGPSGSGISGPSGSGISGSSGESAPTHPGEPSKAVDDKGKKTITDSDFESDYSSGVGTVEPSGLAGPSNYKKPAVDKGERVIGDSDYEPDSPSDSDASSLNYHKLYEINDVINGPTENIEKASKKVLERAQKRTESAIRDCLENSMEGKPLEELLIKHDLIAKELEKRGEIEDIIKEDKGKEKIEREDIIKDKGKRVIRDSDYEPDSPSDSDADKNNSSSRGPLAEANNLIYGHPKNIEKASKELLEQALEATDFIKKDYARRCVENTNLKRHYTDMVRKQNLILDELEKREKEEIIKKEKGNEKKN